MCKELLVIPVNKVVDPKRIIVKKWRAKEEERHKGSLTHNVLVWTKRSWATLWASFFTNSSGHTGVVIF
jgi:hypothetical protein